MSIIQDCPQGVAFCVIGVLGLAYCAYSVRRLGRSFTTWRDGVLLSQIALIFGVAAVSLALLDIRGPGLLTVLSYNHDLPVIRAVFANLHSAPIARVRAEALLQRACEFHVVSRPTFAPAPPEVTEANRAGTAYDKTLWLLARLDNAAARLVVGRETAWVEWTDEKGVAWIFDTAKREPVARQSVSGDQYLPLLEWTKEGLVRPGKHTTNF